MKHLCLYCEKADMVRGRKDKVVEYRGERITVATVDGWHCPRCGEIEFARGEGKRYARAVEKLREAIDKKESAELAGIRKKLKLTQIQAAELLGIPQARLSNMLRGYFRGISEIKMIECLIRLGRNVEIVVKAAPRSKAAGRVSVVFV